MLGHMQGNSKRSRWFTVLTVAAFMTGLATTAQANVSAQDQAPGPVAAQPGFDEATPAAEPQPLAQPSQPAATPDTYDYYADTDPSALTEFRDELQPYGTWVEDSTYGTVWVPHKEVVGDDFAPYVTAGHWELTADDEWMWVSDYPFGWATFHYGRWVWISGRGWAWIPGRVYAPAWVVWRVPEPGYAYIGWAPMPPVYYWSAGVAVGLWVLPPAPYVFCSTTYVFHPHVHHHIVHGHHVHHAAAHTRPHQPARAWSGSANRYRPRPQGPSLNEARVPASARPKQRAQPDPRAMAAARTTPKPTASQAASRARQLQPSARAERSTPSRASRPRPLTTRPNTLSQPSYRGRNAQSLTRPSSPAWQNRRSVTLGQSARPYEGPTRYNRPSLQSPSQAPGRSSTPPMYRTPQQGPSRVSPPSFNSPSRVSPPQQGPSRVSPPSYNSPSRVSPSAPTHRTPSGSSFSAPRTAPSYRAPSSSSFVTPRSSFTPRSSSPSLHGAPSQLNSNSSSGRRGGVPSRGGVRRR